MRVEVAAVLLACLVCAAHQLLFRCSGGSGSGGDYARRLDILDRTVTPNLRIKPIVVGGSGASGAPLVMQILLELGLESRVSNKFLDYYPLGMKNQAIVQVMRHGLDFEHAKKLALQARKLRGLLVKDMELKFARRPVTQTRRGNGRGARNTEGGGGAGEMAVTGETTNGSSGGDDALPWGWKESSAYLTVPVISRALPYGFHFVHVLRDARHLIYHPTSSSEHELVADVWSETYNQALRTAGRVSHTKRKQLSAAVLWTEANEAAERYGRAMAVRGVTYNRLRVEDLVMTPGKSLDAVLRTIGLGGGNSNVLASVVRVSQRALSLSDQFTFDSWKVGACAGGTAWDPRFHYVLQNITRRLLVVYGYEVDDGFDCATFAPTTFAMGAAAVAVAPELPPKAALPQQHPGAALLLAPPLTKPDVPISQVLIFGMHHTGTSILTIAAHALGLYVGDPDDILWSANPLKFWERGDVVAANDAFMGGLHAMGHGPKWVHWGFEASAAEPKKCMTHRATAAQIVSELDARGPWAIKDPRMCLVAAEWLELCSNPVCVLIERDTAEWAWSTARFSRRVLKLQSGSDHLIHSVLGTWLARRDEGATATFFWPVAPDSMNHRPAAQSETLTHSHRLPIEIPSVRANDWRLMIQPHINRQQETCADTSRVERDTRRLCRQIDRGVRGSPECHVAALRFNGLALRDDRQASRRARLDWRSRHRRAEPRAHSHHDRHRQERGAWRAARRLAR
jgi:hypothetical protein